MYLCEHAAKEQDSEKLMDLIVQIKALLEEKERRSNPRHVSESKSDQTARLSLGSFVFSERLGIVSGAMALTLRIWSLMAVLSSGRIESSSACVYESAIVRGPGLPGGHKD